MIKRLAVTLILFAFAFGINNYGFSQEEAFATIKSYIAARQKVTNWDEYVLVEKKYKTKKSARLSGKTPNYLWQDALNNTKTNFFDPNDLAIESEEGSQDALTLTFIRKTQSDFWGKAKLINEDGDWKIEICDIFPNYIPSNLQGCFVELDRRLAPISIIYFKKLTEEEVAQYYFSFGLDIRNDWGLYAGSRLAKYFKNMGITRPEDMSNVILLSYHRYLNNKNINLEEQLEYYKK